VAEVLLSVAVEEEEEAQEAVSRKGSSKESAQTPRQVKPKLMSQAKPDEYIGSAVFSCT